MPVNRASKRWNLNSVWRWLATRRSGPRSHGSRKNATDHMAMHVGKTHVAAAETIGELLVIRPQKLKYRRVQIVRLGDVLHRAHADFIRRSVHAPALDPSPRHPNGEGRFMVIAPVRLRSVRGAAELGGPHHQ